MTWLIDRQGRFCFTQRFGKVDSRNSECGETMNAPIDNKWSGERSGSGRSFRLAFDTEHSVVFALSYCVASRLCHRSKVLVSRVMSVLCVASPLLRMLITNFPEDVSRLLVSSSAVTDQRRIEVRLQRRWRPLILWCCVRQESTEFDFKLRARH